MGIFSRFENKMEDAVEGTADKMVGAPLSPVQIAKKAEKQMRREKMVGAGKQYAPTLYTVLVNADDDERLFGYYPTLAGETETYLAAKAAEHGLVMDGQPLVRFIVDDDLKHGKFEIIAEMVAAPLVAQLRQEEMERYGLVTPRGTRGVSYQPVEAQPMQPMQPAQPAQPAQPNTIMFDQAPAAGIEPTAPEAQQLTAYLYDMTHDRAFTLTGATMGIGRESANHIVIPDINASRMHAEIRQEANGAWVLSDLGSTNGTFVNGRRIKSAPLYDADMVTIGTTELEFQLI